ncbi:hypothetical protein [Nocardia miyunensis]|uniref:hypothetical protein n=1 Tax=Nocardia miyunensis TaxID=282684 RepID=UPI00082BF584|nr:hypothetical protein [Nocardia miyunensis]
MRDLAAEWAHRATHMYLLARTERAGREHEGLTEFIVDMDAVGITVGPIVDLSGEHHFNEVRFDNVPVPAHRGVGTVGDTGGRSSTSSRSSAAASSGCCPATPCSRN